MFFCVIIFLVVFLLLIIRLVILRLLIVLILPRILRICVVILRIIIVIPGPKDSTFRTSRVNVPDSNPCSVNLRKSTLRVSTLRTFVV